MPVIDCHQHFQRQRRDMRPRFRPASATGSTVTSPRTTCGLRSPSAASIRPSWCNSSTTSARQRTVSTSNPGSTMSAAWSAGCRLTIRRNAPRGWNAFPGRGKLVGIRHLIAYEPDPRWLLRPPVLESLACLRGQPCVRRHSDQRRQFESLLAMTRQLPDLKVVLNHMGNPPVPEGGWQPWATTSVAPPSRATCR